MEEIVGWVSAGLLLATISRQVLKQYRSESTEGVSSWLSVGQLASSTGFLAYSWVLDNWVFVATNALILLAAVIGRLICLRNRRRESRPTDKPRPEAAPAPTAP